MALRLVTGMMPGITGLCMPRAARSSTRERYSPDLKKNWVTAKSATSILAAR
jgi:hypothetical protein